MCGLPGHSLHVCDLCGVGVTCVALIVRAWPVWAFLQYCGLQGASETLRLRPCKPHRYKLEAVVLIKSGNYIVPTTLFLSEYNTVWAKPVCWGMHVVGLHMCVCTVWPIEIQAVL